MNKTIEEIVVIICNDYIKGLTNKEISQKYNKHRSVVQSILKRNGIKLKTLSETSRKYTIINFNGEILTNNDAYILGLIYSDGNLNRYCIDICLQEDDKQILDDISDYIYGYNNLSYRNNRKCIFNDIEYKCKNQVRFQLSSKEVTNKLRLLGLCENKSLKIRIPLLNNELYPHFIRGVFDGDGCIFVSTKYKGTNRVSIVGNPNFCLDLKTKIEEFLDINVCINNKTDNVKNISITGNKQIKVFMDWIYKDSDLKLNRKFEKYNKEYNK